LCVVLVGCCQYAARLAENGRAIVAQFTWDRAATLLEDALLVTSYLLGTSSGCLRFPVEGDLAPDTPKKTGTSGDSFLRLAYNVKMD
jgi:hypothetical protein